MMFYTKGYLAHTQLIAHKRIVTYLYTKYCSHILYLVILIGNKYLCIKPLFLFLSMNLSVGKSVTELFYVLAKSASHRSRKFVHNKGCRMRAIWFVWSAHNGPSITWDSTFNCLNEVAKRKKVAACPQVAGKRAKNKSRDD